MTRRVLSFGPRPRPRASRAASPYGRAAQAAAPAAARLEPPIDPNERRVFAIRWNAREKNLAVEAAELCPRRYEFDPRDGRPLAEFVRVAALAVSRRLLGLPLDDIDRGLLGLPEQNDRDLQRGRRKPRRA